MPGRPAYLVDMFLERGGIIHCVRRTEAVSSAAAVSTAMVLVPPMAGSIAFMAVMTADAVHTVSPLASFGEVPDEYLFRLLGPWNDPE